MTEGIRIKKGNCYPNLMEYYFLWSRFQNNSRGLGAEVAEVAEVEGFMWSPFIYTAS